MIKTVAAASVVSVHFFLHTSYYTTAIATTNMFMQSILCQIFLSCVPLFIISTGFLQYKKEASKQYFLNIYKVFVSYIVFDVILLITNSLYFGNQYTVKSAILSIFNFNSDTFPWYVNMYIGLYLLIPFINIMLKSIGKKTFQILMLISLIIIALPSALNPIVKYSSFPMIYFPSWWQGIYPVMYYIIGAYIGKYRPNINRIVCILVALFMALIRVVALMWLKQPVINNMIMSDYASLFVVIQSVAIFLVLYEFNCKSSIACATLKKTSSLTLEIYLYSIITDKILYGLVNFGLPQDEIFKQYFIKMVITSLACSMILAIVYRFLYGKVVLIISVIKRKIHRNRNPILIPVSTPTYTVPKK